MAQEEQEKLLDEALSQIKMQTFQMKRCMDKGLLMDGLKHSTNMLGELRTSKLSPRYYYELYMAVSDELRHLELYLIEEFEKGRKMEDLYELVQYAGNIIPRLYLLITVGVVYIKCSDLPSREILRDLVEMCRGVQHPLRGLFLRNYLLQCMRGDLLPDYAITDIVDGQKDRGSVKDSVDFILLNFCEMNKLWVRMQHQGHSRDKERREQERRELRLLVGSNLDRLSKLEAVTLELYRSTILPQLLEQIIKCRDPIAHEYLMDVIIQVFPDEFHLSTLDMLLRACGQLESQVPINKIVVALIDRLSAYAICAGVSSIPKGVNLFETLSTEINAIIEQKRDLGGEDLVSLFTAMMGLALKVYPDRQDYVDKVMADTDACLDRLELTDIPYNNSVSRELMRLLRSPIDVYRGDLRRLLCLVHLPVLIGRLDVDSRKIVCIHLLTLAIDNRDTVLASCRDVEAFFKLIGALVMDAGGRPPAAVSMDSAEAEQQAEDFAEEQNLVARSIHLIKADPAAGLEEQFRMLMLTRKILGASGMSRLRFTLPPIVMQALIFATKLDAANRLSGGDQSEPASTTASEDSGTDSAGRAKRIGSEAVFRFVHQCCRALIHAHSAEAAIKLYLEAALVMDQGLDFPNREKMLYDIMSEVITLFEEEVKDSRSQVMVISLISSTLERLACFSEDNHNPLRANCARASTSLLRKPDQSRAVAQSAQVFWTGRVAESGGVPLHDTKKVIACLDRAERLANDCVDLSARVQLFVEVLNFNLLFALQGVSQINNERLNNIVDKIRDQLADVDPKLEECEQISKFFSNTMAFIGLKRANNEIPT